MKFRPIFASIMLFGVAGTAFANTSAITNTNSQVQTQLNAMQAQINQMQQIINQNNGGAQLGGGTSLQSTLGTSSQWYNAISVSGLLNVDAVASTRSASAGEYSFAPFTTFGHQGSSDLSLSNADLFVDAQVNDWTKAHVGLNYESDAIDSVSSSLNESDIGFPVIKNISGPIFDEAYVTIGNFTQCPAYFRVGKQYLNFGNYDRYAAVPSFTQLLTQTNATAATLGMVQNNFYGSVYAFRGIADDNGTTDINNYGVNIGVTDQNQDFGYNLETSYISNMADVTYVSATNQAASAMSSFYGFSYTPISSTGYSNKVGAVSLDGSFNVGMFDADAHWVTALSRFGRNVLIDSSSAEIVENTDGSSYLTWKGALPQALTVGGGVTFDVMGHSSRFGVDYQHSWQAENIGLYGLPEDRYEGTYNINVSKNVNIGLDVFHDVDYDLNDGGSQKTATTGLIRLGVMFA